MSASAGMTAVGRIVQSARPNDKVKNLRSRGAFASELCRSSTLDNERVRGRPGAGRTHGPRAEKKHAAEPQVSARTTGLPCAMGLRLIRTLPGVPGLLATVVAGIIGQQLSASVGAPGPYDFAVLPRSFVR